MAKESGQIFEYIAHYGSTCAWCLLPIKIGGAYRRYACKSTMGLFGIAESKMHPTCVEECKAREGLRPPTLARRISAPIQAQDDDGGSPSPT